MDESITKPTAWQRFCHVIETFMNSITKNSIRANIVHPCIYCGQHSEVFELNPSVWSIVTSPENMHDNVCLRCCESRLGRNLVMDDFTDTIVNLPVLFGGALVERQKFLIDTPIPFRTQDIYVGHYARPMSSIRCFSCGHKHHNLPEEGGVVCVCRTVFHNTGGKMMILHYVNPPYKSSSGRDYGISTRLR